MINLDKYNLVRKHLGGHSFPNAKELVLKNETNSCESWDLLLVTRKFYIPIITNFVVYDRASVCGRLHLLVY